MPVRKLILCLHLKVVVYIWKNCYPYIISMVASLISMTLALGVGMIAPKVSIDAEKIVLLYY